MRFLYEHDPSSNLRVVSGRQLRLGTTTLKVVAAHHATGSGVTLEGLSIRQAAKAMGVSRNLLSLVNRAGPEAVEALDTGRVSLAALRIAAEEKSKPQGVVRYVKRVGIPLVVEALQQVVPTENPAHLAQLLLTAFGQDVMGAALDRMTAPHRR